MPRGKNLTDKEKKRIIALRAEGHTYEHIAKSINRGVTVVSDVINHLKGEEYENFTKKCEEIKKDHTKELLASITDNKTLELLEKYRNVLSDEDNIKNGIQGRAKLQVFANVLGMIWDKQLKLKQLTEDINVNHDVTIQGNNLKQAIADSVSIEKIDPMSLIEEDSKN